MAQPDSYRTIAARAQASVVVERSEFIAVAYPVTSEEEAFATLEEIRRDNPKARHNVWAYLLRDGRERCSDDGEPQKTAGLPTLEVLRHSGLVDLAVVTTRYFGGVLLGAGGLVRAYTSAAQQALAAAEPVEYTQCRLVRVTIEYGLYDRVCHLAAAAGGKLGETSFTDQVTLAVLFRAGEEPGFVSDLGEMSGGRAQVTLDEPMFCRF